MSSPAGTRVPINWIATCLVLWTMAGVPALASTTTPAGNEEPAPPGYIADLRRETDRFFDEFLKNQTPAERTRWQRVMLRVRQQFERTLELKQEAAILVKTGAPTYLSTMLSVDYVIVPVLIAMGQPQIAGAIYFSPIPATVTLGRIGLQRTRARRTLARELGIPSISELEDYRRKLLGYELKDRLFTAQVDAARNAAGEGQRQIEVVRAPGTQAGIIATQELETWVAGDGDRGRAYIASIEERRTDSSLFSMLLLRYIESNEGLHQKLIERMGPTASQVPDAELRRRLLRLDDLRKEALALSRRFWLHGTELSASPMGVLAPQRKQAVEFADRRIADLARLTSRIERVEFAMLFEGLRGQAPPAPPTGAWETFAELEGIVSGALRAASAQEAQLAAIPRNSLVGRTTEGRVEFRARVDQLLSTEATPGRREGWFACTRRWLRNLMGRTSGPPTPPQR